jgi:beta-glucuronidase
MPSRRDFFRYAAPAAAAAASPASRLSGAPAPSGATCEMSLNGDWRFRLDAASTWRTVSVPHTWQVEQANVEYYGVAWYERDFEAPASWNGLTVRVEFEAVFHSATVWVNGKPAGEHAGKGYTAFVFDITPMLQLGARNTLRVRVDNSFNDAMLPRGKSSDWAHDGGIYRPVRLIATPHAFVERVEIDAEPDLKGKGELRVKAILKNASNMSVEVREEHTGRVVLRQQRANPEAGPWVIDDVKLWHFDHPHLYTLTIGLDSGHSLTETFGFRRVETRDNGFYLNGERVRLMGVERMAGSNPEYGMAEPLTWLDHDNADLKNLNCIYTRVHWQQDRRLLDWCDRHGMLIQTEVPTWGGETFKGMTGVPSDAIMKNGIEQLREMIARDRNHPCIFSWGLCNEIQGQNPPAYQFAKRMFEEAKKLDPKRLLTYASNSLQKTPEKDVSGLMDYVMWNEYYESWMGGTREDMARNLDEIHRVFPNKAIVISEYGYCACTPERPEGDAMRLDVLREHDRIFRERDYVAGLIFFCYNDYRTHVGDKGTGAAKQRVHGVVDLYGARKPSYEALREESSPAGPIRVAGVPGRLTAVVQSKRAVPSYTMRGYVLRAVAHGFGDVPVERLEAPLSDLAPGASASAVFEFKEKGITRVRFDLLRPTGDSARSAEWRP